MMMPHCGLSFADVSLAALECGGNKTQTAKRLGVAVRSLYSAIDRENLHHWFVPGRGKAPRKRQKCITKEQVQQMCDEGYCRADAAYLLGISVAYLKDLCRQWGISFAGNRKAAYRGYC